MNCTGRAALPIVVTRSPIKGIDDDQEENTVIICNMIPKGGSIICREIAGETAYFWSLKGGERSISINPRITKKASRTCSKIGD
jgi:hypothetical protein